MVYGCKAALHSENCIKYAMEVGRIAAVAALCPGRVTGMLLRLARRLRCLPGGPTLAWQAHTAGGTGVCSVWSAKSGCSRLWKCPLALKALEDAAGPGLALRPASAWQGRK